MKTDRRVKYTRMVLRESLLEILKERPIERITVKEICDMADVNRSTFYVHYGSPQELLDSIRKEMYDEIVQKKRDFTDVKSYMNQICEVIYEYRDLMTVLVKSGKVEQMMQIANLWKDDFIRGMGGIGLPMEKLETAFLYVTCGAFSVIITWVLGFFEMPIEDVADEVYRLTLGALNIYSREEDNNV